jgi:hypothetical protein
MQQFFLITLMLAILFLLVVVVFLLLRRKPGSEPAHPSQRQNDLPAPDKSIDNLEPGDGVAFWGGDNVQVQTVMSCSEQVNERTNSWRWIILSNDQLIWLAPDGKYLYDAPNIIYQGTLEFEQITGEPGVLKVFEQRVREGVSGAQPVHFAFGEANYTVKSTGTFSIDDNGAPPTQQVWSDVSPDGSQNVYFEMEAETGDRALGIWTSHIAWYIGRVLKDTDIEGVFPRQNN